MAELDAWMRAHWLETLILIGIALTWLQTYLVSRALLALWRHMDSRIDRLGAGVTAGRETRG